MTVQRPLPRVVLLEDDPSLRRFAEMALEDMPIDLLACARSVEALQAFEQGPVSLLLSDLMLAGESSLPLLERLAREPSLRGTARVVVLSAGLTPETHRHLAGLSVWRVLAKPIGLKELEACVEQALAGTAPEVPSAGPGESPGQASHIDQDEAAVIARHFDGDAALYRAFRQSCIEQFRLDVQAGDAAAGLGDAQALRRVAHNLKTVLGSLGHAALSLQAAALERAAEKGALEAAASQWAGLRTPLLGLTDSGSNSRQI